MHEELKHNPVLESPDESTDPDGYTSKKDIFFSLYNPATDSYTGCSPPSNIILPSFKLAKALAQLVEEFIYDIAASCHDA